MLAVIAIDDVSIANIGRWLWSREIHARMSDLSTLLGGALRATLAAPSILEVDIKL